MLYHSPVDDRIIALLPDSGDVLFEILSITRHPAQKSDKAMGGVIRLFALREHYKLGNNK
jgi:hypothetical protein